MKKRLLKYTIFFVVTSLFLTSCEEDFFSDRSLSGTWSVFENSSSFGEQNFLVGIDYFQGDSTRISIDNFSNLGLEVAVIANLNGNVITIPNQTIRDKNNNSFTVTGNGTISNNFRKIDMVYRWDSHNFTAVFQKQF